MITPYRRRKRQITIKIDFEMLRTTHPTGASKDVAEAVLRALRAHGYQVNDITVGTQAIGDLIPDWTTEEKRTDVEHT